MDWIAGTGRDRCGQLCVKTQRLDGSRALVGLASLRADLHLTGTIRRKVVIPLHDLQPGDTQQYLDDLCLSDLDAGGQPVYEVLTDAGLLVIPAQLLVLAVLGANSQFREVLLRPWGPGFLMSAFAEHRSGKLSVLPTPHRMLKLQLERLVITSKVEWVLSYPSATAAWGSVYRHALDGRFDMDMPRAFATVSVMARPVNGKLLVAQLQLMTLSPDEESHPFAAGIAKRDFVFNEGVDLRPTHGRAAAPTHDTNFAPSTGHVVNLTDEQWARIGPRVQDSLQSKGSKKPGAPRTHSLREVIDVIRLKLGTPYSWSQVPADKKLVQGATVLLSKLKRNGVWAVVVDVGNSCPL